MAHSKPTLIRVHLFGYIFSPSLLPTLGVIFLLPLLIGLGVWQLDRAAEKKALERDFFAKRKIIKLTDLNNPQDRNLRYRSIQITGSFDTEHLIFLDNKIHQQQIGYHVFSPFIAKGTERILLVNRGFIASAGRNNLPTLTTPQGERTIKGLIYFPEKPFLLKKEKIKNEWPQVVQAINFKDMEIVLNKSTYPFYLLLQQGELSPLIKDWHPVSFPSYRHTGYAIQWFSLALTLVVLYLVLNTSRVKS